MKKSKNIGLSILCHICGFACQQRVLKKLYKKYYISFKTINGGVDVPGLASFASI